MVVTTPGAKGKVLFRAKPLPTDQFQHLAPEAFMRDVQQIRNTVILGHGHSGKTTLAEALLFTADAIGRLGRVDEGSSTLDFEDEEVRRKLSINTAFGHLDWQGCEIFLTDTPGDDNFVNETKFAARMADSALLTGGGVLGVRSQTERFVDNIKQGLHLSTVHSILFKQ